MSQELFQVDPYQINIIMGGTVTNITKNIKKDRDADQEMREKEKKRQQETSRGRSSAQTRGI